MPRPVMKSAGRTGTGVRRLIHNEAERRRHRPGLPAAQNLRMPAEAFFERIRRNEPHALLLAFEE